MGEECNCFYELEHMVASFSLTRASPGTYHCSGVYQSWGLWLSLSSCFFVAYHNFILFSNAKQVTLHPCKGIILVKVAMETDR